MVLVFYFINSDYNRKISKLKNRCEDSNGTIEKDDRKRAQYANRILSIQKD